MLSFVSQLVRIHFTMADSEVDTCEPLNSLMETRISYSLHVCKSRTRSSDSQKPGRECQKCVETTRVHNAGMTYSKDNCLKLFVISIF